MNTATRDKGQHTSEQCTNNWYIKGINTQVTSHKPKQFIKTKYTYYSL